MNGKMSPTQWKFQQILLSEAQSKLKWPTRAFKDIGRDSTQLSKWHNFSIDLLIHLLTSQSSS